MWQSIRRLLFGFLAICCCGIGLFWFWFMYEFSLKWLDATGQTVVGPETTVAFGQEGAVWIGLVAVGWLILGGLFGFMQWRFARQGEKHES